MVCAACSAVPRANDPAVPDLRGRPFRRDGLSGLERLRVARRGRIWMHVRDYSADISKALATPGGHLMIGRGGFSLHYLNEYGGQGSLSGYDCEAVKH